RSASVPRQGRKPAADMLETSSSLSRDARIVVNALQRDAGGLPVWRLARLQMPCHHIPHRRAGLLIDRGPAGDLVALAGLKRTAVGELQFGDPAADIFCRRASIGQAADADHIAALL